MRKNLLISVVVVVLLSGFAAVLRYTPVARSLLEQSNSNSESMLTREAIAKRFHTAPGQCLRYETEAAPPSELELVANSLREAGLSSTQVADLAGALLRWGNEREAAVHARTEDDELLQLMEEELPLLLRRLFWLKREQLRVNLTGGTDAVFARGAAALETLPPEQRIRLHALWEQHAGALNLSSIVQLIPLLRIRETQEQLEAVARVLEEQVRGGAPLPSSLSELRGLPPEALRDAWQNDFQLDPAAPGGARLRSLGRDGVEGGTGPDADIVRELVLPQEPIKEASSGNEPSAQTGCGPRRAVAHLSRAEVQRRDGNLDFLGTARIVPAFENGAVYGFKLFAIQPDSLGARVGLCNGDVLVALAGFPLTSPENALQAYARAKGARTVKLKVRRQGKDADLTVYIH